MSFDSISFLNNPHLPKLQSIKYFLNHHFHLFCKYFFIQQIFFYKYIFIVSILCIKLFNNFCNLFLRDRNRFDRFENMVGILDSPIFHSSQYYININYYHLKISELNFHSSNRRKFIMDFNLHKKLNNFF